MSAVVQHHKKHHKTGKWLPRVEDCWRCIESKSNCAQKNTYKSRREVNKTALLYNIKIRWWPGACQVPYHCFWCERWHVTTATRRDKVERAEKMRQRWLRRTGLKDTFENGHWDLSHFYVAEYDYDEDDWDLPETG